MDFWRICRLPYAAEAWSGEGARLFGGRWNSRGVRMVYASTSLALASVETFVNLEPKLRPAVPVAVSGTTPPSLTVERLDLAALPTPWYDSRDESLRTFGDDWIRRRSSVALLVPSAAILGEWNVLLNPQHPGFTSIQLRKPKPFRFDLKMFPL